MCEIIYCDKCHTEMSSDPEGYRCQGCGNIQQGDSEEKSE